MRMRGTRKRRQHFTPSRKRRQFFAEKAPRKEAGFHHTFIVVLRGGGQTSPNANTTNGLFGAFLRGDRRRFRPCHAKLRHDINQPPYVSDPDD